MRAAPLTPPEAPTNLVSDKLAERAFTQTHNRNFFRFHINRRFFKKHYTSMKRKRMCELASTEIMLLA